MDQGRALSATHLRNILIWLLGMHGDVNATSRHDSGLRAVLQAEGHLDVAVQIDFHAISQLAKNLRIVTALDDPSDAGTFAQVMADIATIVNDFKPLVADMQSELGRIHPLGHKLRMEFSIACVVAFAESWGYSIPIGSLPNDQISLVFLMRDWSRLVRIFAESIAMTLRATTRSDRSEEGEESPEQLIRHLEMQFAEASPIPEPTDIGLSRQLSAESYWNLRSVAEQKNWRLVDILTLIEEHLQPVSNPNVLYHSSTVSGDDWQRLYNWLHREDGRML